MPPRSGTRRSARKRGPSSRQLASVEAASPSRPAKKRRTNVPATPPPVPEPEQDEDEEEEDEADGNLSDVTETQALTEPADRIIPFLFEAEEPVAVSLLYSNKATEDTVSAYAKIAGKNWTFYVRQSSVKIGRAPDARPSVAGNSPGLPDDAPNADIDLGPSKMISRGHAEICYDPDDEKWHFLVKGRNGARVNDSLLRRGQQTDLVSGDVIEIGGTEMVFISPDVQAVVHAKYAERSKQQPAVAKPELAQTQSDGQSHGHPQAASASQQFQSPTHVSPYAAPSANGQQPMLAPAPPNYARPSTPVNSIMQHPYLAQNAQSAPAPPPYEQPVLMESNEQIDYSKDALKYVKPPMSYATLIAQAILAGPNERSSLNGIYEWIKTHFSYYRHIEQSWQNSIRHNLSLNAAFEKAPREPHEPGKGGMWYIVDAKKEEYRRSGLKMTSRGGARQSSNPSSPVPKRSPKKKTPPRGVGNGEQHGQTSWGNAGAPAGKETRTPSRTSVPPGGHAGEPKLPHFSDDASPLPLRAPYLSQAAAGAGSPPTLASSALFGNQNNLGYNLFTPAPVRYEPRMTAPSTVRLPSQYLPPSSPGGFWGNVDTPARLPDTSPIKLEGNSAPLPPSSSPPPAEKNGSPTRARINGIHGLGISQATEDMGEDEGPLDLMGSFQKIGDRRVSSAAH